MTKTKPYKCSRKLERQLLRWALSGNTGKSSKYMAGVAAFGRTYRPTHRELPRDYDDLQRCVRMVAECKSFRQALPELAHVSPLWLSFVKRWDVLQALAEHNYDSNFAHSAYSNIRNQIEQPNDE